jgi:hypothetical protein
MPLSPFEAAVAAMISLWAQRRMLPPAPSAPADYEKALLAIHDRLLEQDVFSDEEVMLKCAELRQEMTSGSTPPVGPPSLESRVLLRALRELLIAKGVFTAQELALTA